MPDRVRELVAEKFAGELRACAEKLGGPAKEWRKLYGV
jgi:hypothetical protein